MKVLGIDISGGFATAILLERQPANLLEYYHSEEYAPFDFEPNREDFQALIDLQPDVVAWEPTGTHYELIYKNWFRRHGIECRRIAAKRVASYRNDSALDKTDGTDALAIASYTLKRYEDKSAFIHECELEEFRDLFLQKEGLNKMLIRYCQRLKLQLQHELPEAADGKINARKWGESHKGLISFLMDEAKPASRAYWDNKCKASIGSGLSKYTRWLAKHVWEIGLQCQEIEHYFDKELARPEFKPYLEAFDQVGLSKACQIVWLTRVYPFEKFLKDGQENIIRRLNSNGKLCKYNLSLSQFKASLGAGTIRNESGQRQGKNARTSKVRSKRAKKKKAPSDDPTELPIGDRFCRKAYFIWHLGNVERGTLKSPLADQILAKNREQISKGKNGFQRTGNLQGYCSRLLYRELKARLLQ